MVLNKVIYERRLRKFEPTLASVYYGLRAVRRSDHTNTYTLNHTRQTARIIEKKNSPIEIAYCLLYYIFLNYANLIF